MDLLYIGTKFYEDGTSMPGNQFRDRFPSDSVQIGRAITGLPCNFYDAQWLQRLRPHQRTALNVQCEVDLSFNVDERRYVPFPDALISQKVTVLLSSKRCNKTHC